MSCEELEMELDYLLEIKEQVQVADERSECFHQVSKRSVLADIEASIDNYLTEYVSKMKFRHSNMASVLDWK